MRSNWITGAILLLLTSILQLPAQQHEPNRKWFEDIKAKAEKGDAVSQHNLAVSFDKGDGVAKDSAEAMKWFRKAAEQDFAPSAYYLGIAYATGDGVLKDDKQAVYWWRKAAEKGFAEAQFNLGTYYASGKGVQKDSEAAAEWYRRAAEQNLAVGQINLGFCYAQGDGVEKDLSEAVRWFHKAAEQNDAKAQFILSSCYIRGDGVLKDYVEAYKWILLAGAQEFKNAREEATELERLLTRQQIADGQALARSFNTRKVITPTGPVSENKLAQFQPTASGTGFFISDDGYLISNNHVVEGANQVRLVTSAGLISAKVVKVDAANDLALLKAEGRFAPLPLSPSRGVKLGGTVVTVGFPNIGLQGFAPKLAKGEIAALSGAGDDARYFQISVPVQPGNSGGALVDERGNVVGVVSAKLNASAALRSSGALPENVNYAVKSSYLLSFLESVPDVAATLKEPSAKEKKFEDVVKEAEQAAVLVLVY